MPDIPLPADLYARLVRIAEIAGVSIEHIAESGIEDAVSELEAYHEVEDDDTLGIQHESEGNK